MPLEEEAEEILSRVLAEKPLLMRNARFRTVCPLDTDELAGLLAKTN